MLSKKEKKILSELRNDSRKNIVQISKDTGIPVSSTAVIIKKLEKKYDLRHFSHLDYSKLGYHLHVNYKITTQDKALFHSFLKSHPSVNNASTILNDIDYDVNCIFKDLKQVIEFRELLQSKGANFKETFIVDEIKKEGFSFDHDRY
jgi:DNA-binding Lrp family transcriptional regulator